MLRHGLRYMLLAVRPRAVCLWVLRLARAHVDFSSGSQRGAMQLSPGISRGRSASG